jgi:hypothetical protein
MGIFGTLGKILQGKPVFEPTNNMQGEHAQAQNQPGGSPFGAGQPQGVAQAPAGPKQMPHVEFERIVCHSNGTHMDCDAFIQNNSHDDVDLDRLSIMGGTYDLGRVLRPGEEHEFRIYSGNRPNNTSYTRAELTAKDHTGDYFQLIYYVQFKAMGDGTYVIDRVQSQQVRDI